MVVQILRKFFEVGKFNEIPNPLLIMASDGASVFNSKGEFQRYFISFLKRNSSFFSFLELLGNLTEIAKTNGINKVIKITSVKQHSKGNSKMN